MLSNDALAHIVECILNGQATDEDRQKILCGMLISDIEYMLQNIELGNHERIEYIATQMKLKIDKLVGVKHKAKKKSST